MPDRRFFYLLVLDLVLQAVVGAANGGLSRFSLSLTLDALPIVAAGLYLPTGPAFLLVVLAAFLREAFLPLPPGSLASLHVFALALILLARSNLRRDLPAHVAVVALLANLIVFGGITFLQLPETGRPPAHLLRVVQDLALSQVVLLAILPRTLQGVLALGRSIRIDLAAGPPLD